MYPGEGRPGIILTCLLADYLPLLMWLVLALMLPIYCGSLDTSC